MRGQNVAEKAGGTIKKTNSDGGTAYFDMFQRVVDPRGRREKDLITCLSGEKPRLQRTAVKLDSAGLSRASPGC